MNVTLVGLTQAIEDFLTATHKRRRFVKKNQEIFDTFSRLEKSEKHAEDLAKIAAREHAVPGRTVVPLENSEVKVMVIGGHEGVRYDAGEAAASWPKDVLSKVLVVDAKKVAALVELGELDVALADKAVLDPVPLSPRVKIEVLGK